MTIVERYKTMNKTPAYVPTDDIEKVIRECFEYNILKLKPTKKDKEWFKKCFDADYPIEENELTKKLIRELKQCIKVRRKDKQFEEKMSTQRKERGYSDSDVWSIKDWFLSIMPDMLQQMRDNLHGCPVSNYPNNSQALMLSEEEKTEQCFIRWQETLDRMIFLLKEMNEDTCSFKNRYQEAVDKASDEFHKKYGWFGEKFEELNGIDNQGKVSRIPACGGLFLQYA